MLKAVLFDLDGVVTDSSKYHYLAWKQLAERLEIPFDEEYNEQLKGVSRMESLDLILKNAAESNPAKKMSDAEKQICATEKNDYYKTLIKQITPADILPGIREFIGELRSASIKIGLASVSLNAPSIIASLQLGEKFDTIVDAGAVKRAKPFPDIFLRGAEILGVTPEECIGIEDAKAGITAIKNAGMKAVGVGTRSEMAEADLILDSTAQLSLKLILDKFFS